jgi:L-ascorbate metabolism protein UlaG (beta-lactamase superfamily)
MPVTIRTHFLVGVLFMTSFCGFSNSLAASASQPEKFTNTHIEYKTTWRDMWRVTKAYFQDNRNAATPTFDIPVSTLTSEMLDAVTEDSVIKLGHSTTLLKLAESFILIDPVFSDRASPVQWLGPKRFHQSPISLENLPNLDAVIISHDHYDHLDKGSIEILKNKVDMFITPLKVGNHLRNWGVDANKIVELNWWQSIKVSDIEIVATPSQHFSGRGLFDRDETLWASFVIRSLNTNIFYSGDSGYFDGFKAIGNKYGPFDLSMIETGAYNELWSDIHMLPEESLQAHIDVQASVMMPVHNSTFDLALHNWNEPLMKITGLADEKGVPTSIPIFGEIVPVKRAGEAPNKVWWLDSK